MKAKFSEDDQVTGEVMGEFSKTRASITEERETLFDRM